MLELLILLAIGGSAIAGLWDLKTTEVPDEIPALMITTGLFVHYMAAGMSGDFYPLMLSILAGTALLAVGLIMYHKGQWGGADAWILAAIGYMIPLYSGRVFIVDYLLNFLVVSAAYMVIYAAVIGMMNRSVFGYFRSEMKVRWKVALGIPACYAIALASMAIFLPAQNMMPMLYTLGLITFLTIFWVYGKVIEKYAFRKKILSSKLKVGDVTEDMLWVGITQDQIDRIKKEKKYVTIKEGVRFVPVFPITLVVTLLYGNILTWLLFV